MKKILLSLAIVSAVAASMIYGTRAYFTDTETATGNTFSTGTIDIAVDNENPWSENFALNDMKPSYTDYINFTIKNVGTNPANIVKKIENVATGEGVMSEPECAFYGGTWVDYGDHCSGGTEKHNIDTVINYDLSVEVYDESDNKIWWQTIYTDSEDVTITDIAAMADGVYLGMLPVNWTMKVTQSYHMRKETENWAQGDTMSFNIVLEAKQLIGSAILENKTADPEYDIIQGDSFKGTLTYKMSYPTFEFEFNGTGLRAGVRYTLLAAKDPWPQTGSIVLGTGTANASGDINVTGNLNTGSMTNQKVWLVLSSDWNGSEMTLWHQTDYLLETGLIEYHDTD